MITLPNTNGNHSHQNGKRKLHVLEIIGNAIVGGMERHVRALIENLPSEQFEITCICPYESPFTENLRRLGCHVLILPIKDDPPWHSVQCGVAWVKQFGVDLIHAHLPNAHALAGLIGGLTQTPVIATIHGMHLTPLDLSICQTAGTHLLLVCQAAYVQALALGVPKSQAFFVLNGVDLKQFGQHNGKALRRTLGLKTETPLIGFVGRLAWEKGPDRFVRAAELIHRERPDARFILVGAGAMEDPLRKMIRQAKLEKFVRLMGLYEDTSTVYPALDVVVQPSRSEGMPLAVLEAMACGRPVVGMAVGGLPELIEPGKTGFLIDTGDQPSMLSIFQNDWEGIASAVLYLLKRPALMKQMGHAARARVETQFGMEQNIRQTTDLFRRLTYRHEPRLFKSKIEMLNVA